MTDTVTRLIAGHAVTGSYCQPGGFWTTFCRCEETFDGPTKDASLDAWAEHVAARADGGAATAASDGERVWPAALTPELRAILGMPNFQCGPMAHVFQAIGEYSGAEGVELQKRAEDEQAFILHKFVALWFQHGEAWSASACDELERAAKQARAAIAKATVAESDAPETSAEAGQ